MPLDWSGSIIIGATEAHVSFIAMDTRPDAHGHATIRGKASFGRYNQFHAGRAEVMQKEFGISLAIDGRLASQAKLDATVWPAAFDEVTENDGVIGIIFKADEFDERPANLFLHPNQFDKIMPMMGLGIRAGITLFVRESTLSDCFLIVRADFGTTLFAPQE